MTDKVPHIDIPRELIEKRVSRSGGAGGQHVNKTNSKVEIRFKLMTAEWIPNAVRRRMRKNYPSRVNKEGELCIYSSESRSQHQNEEDCFAKLKELITASWFPPKKRVKTKPSRAAKERRLSEKKKNSERKKNRKL